MIFYLFILIAILGPIIHLVINKQFKSTHRVIEIFLVYILFSLVGLTGIYAFLGHAFIPDEIAAYIGWPAGNPFQFEVACANLAFGVLGILCIWLRGDFWTATIIGSAIYLLGCAYGHLRNIVLYHNYAPGNAGLVLYLDILVPIVLIILLITYRKTK